MFQANWTRPDNAVVVVAMKTLDSVTPEKLDQARNEMLREARIMRELSGHANLVRAFGVTIDKEVPNAIMEFMSGKI